LPAKQLTAEQKQLTVAQKQLTAQAPLADPNDPKQSAKIHTTKKSQKHQGDN